jgi:pyruvate/2-oxoglutarate dehydrogenase complex dihydrolipoamide dehydrogenase (E3) component
MGKALIIGGTGFIGMEMGEAFVTRGIETEIINRGDLPAPRWAP